MTQKTLAEQVAELQNNLIALDKIINAPTPEKKVKCFRFTYDDGSTQWFAPISDEDATDQLDVKLDNKTIKKKPRPGYPCIIRGVRYNSVMHAARELGLCRHRVKCNLDIGLREWAYL